VPRNVIQDSHNLAPVGEKEVHKEHKDAALVEIEKEVMKYSPRGFMPPDEFQGGMRDSFDAAVIDLREAKTTAEVTMYKNEALSILVEARTALKDAAARKGDEVMRTGNLDFGSRLQVAMDVLGGTEGNPLSRLMKALKILMTGKVYTRDEVAKMDTENKKTIEAKVGLMKSEYSELRDQHCGGKTPKNLRHVFAQVGASLNIENPLASFMSEGMLDSIAEMKDNHTAATLLERSENFRRHSKEA
jgi:hypothetical protein